MALLARYWREPTGMPARERWADAVASAEFMNAAKSARVQEVAVQVDPERILAIAKKVFAQEPLTPEEETEWQAYRAESRNKSDRLTLLFEKEQNGEEYTPEEQAELDAHRAASKEEDTRNVRRAVLNRFQRITEVEVRLFLGFDEIFPGATNITPDQWSWSAEGDDWMELDTDIVWPAAVGEGSITVPGTIHFELELDAVRMGPTLLHMVTGVLFTADDEVEHAPWEDTKWDRIFRIQPNNGAEITFRGPAYRGDGIEDVVVSEGRQNID
jgi:hypothetical protein